MDNTKESIKRMAEKSEILEVMDMLNYQYAIYIENGEYANQNTVKFLENKLKKLLSHKNI